MFSYLFSNILNSLTNNNIVESIYNNQSYVSYIYDILFICLLIMNTTIIWFIFTPSKEKKTAFFKKSYLLMEFSINFPLTAGVMGTLISINDALTKGADDLANIISGNFSAAILTTVMGGAIYGYSFLSQAIMSRYVS